MRLAIHPREQRDLLKSWAAISLAFAIVMTGLGTSKAWMLAFLSSLAISAVTVGLGFLAHELAHKHVAESLNCHAEYRANDTMLLVALVTSLFGIVLAAPGAVLVSGHPSPEQRGKTSVAGPAANLALAAVFLALFFLLHGWLAMAAGFGSVINTWLGLFNMLPFGAFDGAKVFAWNKAFYGLVVAIGVLLAFVQVPLGLF